MVAIVAASIVLYSLGLLRDAAVAESASAVG
jgi:hypothetical protein